MPRRPLGVCRHKHDPHGHLTAAARVSRWAPVERPSYFRTSAAHTLTRLRPLHPRARLTCVINNSNSGRVVGGGDVAPGSCPLGSGRRADMKETTAAREGPTTPPQRNPRPPPSVLSRPATHSCSRGTVKMGHREAERPRWFFPVRILGRFVTYTTAVCQKQRCQTLMAALWD
ncbi:hypothetical protein AAFF_G00074330 [Aldrovandia affinis]|uniref:Uncharacterized protein n=1 Tax=Aldrovandia affinis TaxID=143900 RepID=A0AAD7RYI5_9TELE|nr:hypothetical protein AAFF_G00074330 [Aldrovandia affinis]